MYEQFFGLRERPFELTANPRYLFLTVKHREALSTLIYGLSARKGLTVITGEAGTGKTTLLGAALLQWHAAGHLVVALRNPTMTRHEFQEFLAREFGLGLEAARSKTTLLHEIEILLRQRHADGLLTALVLDEAHSMPIELLEEVRLLANIETADTKLLPLILLGQPELADRLNEPSLRQLKQRVALRCRLEPLDLRETAAYIAKRIRLAGGDSLRLFTREAVEAVYEGSGGIPRLINVICDNALVNGMAANEQPVGQDTIREVCADFDLPNGQAKAASIPLSTPAAAPPAVEPVADAVDERLHQPASAGPAPDVRRATSPRATQARLLGSSRLIPLDEATEDVPEDEPEPARAGFLRRSLSFFRT
jgi:general secretion pathway protein A